jgi:hypothetical protein
MTMATPATVEAEINALMSDRIEAVRATQGLRLVGDKWRIVDEHSSLPFDMASGKVSFALKP